MDQATGPAKPPRVAAPGQGEPRPQGGGRPPRGSTSSEGGRTLWQIFWNEEEEEPVVSKTDISNMDEEEINTATSSNPTVQMRQQNGEVVLFEKRSSTGSATRENGKIYTEKEFKEQDWEAFDVTPKTRSAGRVLLRSESDNELMLPSASLRTQSLSVSLRWCCINCRHFAFWQQYWWVPLVIVLILVVYVIVTVVIIKALGS